MFDLPPADPPTPAPATAIIGTAWAAPANPHPLVPAAQAILVDPRIASGVATMIAEAPDPREVPANQQGDLQRAVLGSAAAEKFSKDFSMAKVPSCGGNDALKFQPARIGPIGVGGLLALPFVALAAVRGKCLMH
jgi:hypothetical protein